MILPLDPTTWPAAQYDVVLADPPWLYKNKSRNRGALTRHYSAMSEDALIALPVASLCKPTAVLFLWATGPNLPMAIRLMAFWGFTYKTIGFTWLKSNADGTLFMGVGNYTRANAELCLIGTRGKMLKRADASVRQAQIHPRGAHSAKPLGFHDSIERLYGPEVRRVELFARNAVRPGWDFWGDHLG